MTESMTMSTPAETQSVDTSSSEPTNQVDTSTAEPTNNENFTADNGNENGNENHHEDGELLAGKFKTQEELAKAYKELEPIVGQAGQYKKRIEELETQLKSQEENKQKQLETKQAEQLQQAKSQGFNSYEELEISNKCKIAEFEYLATNLDKVNNEYAENARQALINYYQTGNQRHLDEAKKYFDASTLEKCSLVKNDLKNKLTGELQEKKKADFLYRQEDFVKSLETNEINKDFLQDISTNGAKLDALKVFFHQGLIQSQDDFNVFKALYSAVEEQAIKAFQAKQQADNNLQNEKNKATFSNGGNSQGDNLGNSKLTFDYIENCSNEEYDKLVDKYGLEKVMQARQKR